MSQRVRRRYLAFRVMGEQPIDEGDVARTIWGAVLELFGEYGASQASLSLIKYDRERGCGVLRCSHKALEMVRASIASITEIHGKPTAIHVVGVSGTLRALRKRTPQ